MILTKLFVIFLLSGRALGDYAECETPKSEEGECKPFKECQELFDLYKLRPISSETRELIRDSRCATKNFKPWVCCPKALEDTAVTILEDSEPEWLRSLKEKVPESPDCGVGAEDRIHGGKKAGFRQFPWMVLLQFLKPENQSGFHCGGSLINNKYVLTAAHCVKKMENERNWNLVKVRVGEHDLIKNPDCDPDDPSECNEDAYDNNVVEKFTHPGYKEKSVNQHFDIALLRLAKKVVFSDNLTPICLPLDSALWNKEYTGHSFHVAGWGKTEDFDQSPVKLKIVISAKSENECRTLFAPLNRQIIDSQICAGAEEGKDSCNGDSGGPLMATNNEVEVPYMYLAGVVSYGARDCGTEGMPGIYTRVSSFLKWFSENIRK